MTKVLTVIRKETPLAFDLAKYDGFVIVEGNSSDLHRNCYISEKYYRQILVVHDENSVDFVYQVSNDKINWVDSWLRHCYRGEEDMKWLKSWISELVKPNWLS